MSKVIPIKLCASAPVSLRMIAEQMDSGEMDEN